MTPLTDPFTRAPQAVWDQVSTLDEIHAQRVAEAEAQPAPEPELPPADSEPEVAKAAIAELEDQLAGTPLYDETLRPVDLRAGQLALLWAILATEPVEMVRLGAMTLTDPTTLSRTVANLRETGLVNVRRGDDGRTKMLSLSEHGRERFAAAMPYWEEAQRRVARLLPVLDVRALARRVHKAAQQS